MSIYRIIANDRWLNSSMSIPHNGMVMRPQTQGTPFGCEQNQAHWLTENYFARYCLADGTPCEVDRALLQSDAPAADAILPTLEMAISELTSTLDDSPEAVSGADEPNNTETGTNKSKKTLKP